MSKKKLYYFNRHRLLYLRLKHKLTQKRMGEVAGVSRTLYQKYEYGEIRRMKERNLLRWCEHFQVDMSYLMQNYTEEQLLKLESASEGVREAEKFASDSEESQRTYDNKLKLLDAEIKLANAALYTGEDKISRHEDKKEKQLLSEDQKQVIRDVLGE